MKPILFNSEMVRAILDGRKTVTRRIVKKQPNSEMPSNHNYCRMPLFTNKGKQTLYYMDVIEQYPFKQTRYFESFAPYEEGDILYVRETWNENPAHDLKKDFEGLPPKEQFGIYKADNPDFSGGWRPSIHMPKEVARIFLKVTGVKVERLQDMCIADCVHEGVDTGISWTVDAKPNFIRLWDSTIKKSDIDHYGWNANPWVWVIEFERIRKEEA